MSGLPKAIVLVLGPWYMRLLRAFAGTFLAGVLVAGMVGAYEGCHAVSFDFEANIVKREAREHVRNKFEKIIPYVIAGCTNDTNKCVEAIEAVIDCL